MITRKQFFRLRHGDVVLWGSGVRRCHRTVLQGPGDRAGSITTRNPSIRLAKRARSQYFRTVTCYTFTDVRQIITPTRRRLSTVVSSGEAQRLADMGFDVAAEYAREIKESRRCNQAFGRPCPFEPMPLPFERKAAA